MCSMRVLDVNEKHIIKLDSVRTRSRLGLFTDTKRPKTQYTCLMENELSALRCFGCLMELGQRMSY